MMVSGLGLVVAKIEPLAPALTVVSSLDGPVGDSPIIAHQLIARQRSESMHSIISKATNALFIAASDQLNQPVHRPRLLPRLDMDPRHGNPRRIIMAYVKVHSKNID